MATQDERIRFIFDTQDNSSKKLANIALAVTGINQAMQIARQVAEAAKKAWDFTKEGANLLRTEDKFNRLKDTIGATGLSAEQLQAAMGGLVSESEAMALGVDLMSLGLVKSQDELERMARVVGGLGMDMNQLVLTLTNMTTMRFDALGVSVDGFKDKVAELEEQGLSAQEAFTEAFLEQAEEQMEKVGDEADTLSGKMERLEAISDDFWNQAKTNVAEAAEPLVDYVISMSEANDLMERAVAIGLLDAGEAGMLAPYIKENAEMWELWTEKIEGAEAAMERTVVTSKDLAGKLGITNAEVGSLADSWAELNEKELRKLQIDAILAGDYSLATALGEQIDLVEKQADAMDELIKILDELDGRKITYKLIAQGGGAGAVGTLGGHQDARDSSGRAANQGGYTGQDFVIPDWEGARGGDFVVPPGFPNDSFTMGVQSGEHVQVTPAGKSPNADVVAAIKDLKDEMYRINQELVAANS